MVYVPLPHFRPAARLAHRLVPQSLTRLAVLDLPTGATWGSSFVFPVLPLCEVVWS